MLGDGYRVQARHGDDIFWPGKWVACHDVANFFGVGIAFGFLRVASGVNHGFSL